MKKYYSLSLVISLIVCLYSSPVLAQITIGSAAEPAEYSILQLENTTRPNAGLRLPQVSESDRDGDLAVKMATDGNIAKGLTIYNTTSNKVEYWNGTEWIEIPVTIPTVIGTYNGNGLSKTVTANALTKTDTHTLGLGGALTENTNITLNDNLTFSQPTGGRFTVNSTASTFVVAGNKVGMNTNNPSAKLHIAKSTSKNGFRLADGSQGVDKILITNANGDASWGVLGEYIESFNEGVLGSGDITSEMKIANSLTCDAGKWLIIAKCATKKTGSVTTNCSWLTLKSGSTVLAVAGVTPEKNANNNYSTPLIVYYGEFSAPTTVDLYAQGPSGTSLQYFLDNGYFTAIKLSK